MSEVHKVEYKKKKISYILEIYGVEVDSVSFDEGFFGSPDYKRVQKYSDDIESMFCEESYVQKGSKETRALSFSEALGFLLGRGKKRPRLSKVQRAWRNESRPALGDNDESRNSNHVAR